MKLVFNTQSLRPPMTGIGNYTFHLLEQYIECAGIDEMHCFNGTQWLSGEEQLAATALLRAHGSDVSERIVDRMVERIRKAAVRVPGAKPLYSTIMDKRFCDIANRIPGAIYHETNYILRPYSGPSVTTVHDFSYKTHADFHPPNVIAWLDAKLPKSIEQSDCIITDSNLVRDELLQYFDIPEHKVRTVYLGVDACYQPRSQQQTATVLSTFGLSHGHYVLLTATLEPRKGIDTLLDAWGMLPESLRREFPRY
ncbi:MAG: glycosyltransferase [Halioglobus sp.]